MSLLRSLTGSRSYDPEGRRMLGFLPETNEPVWQPPGHCSVFGANGAGKSTRVSMPTIFSYAKTAREKPVLVADVKDGELSAQCTDMLDAMGIPVAVLDDLNVRPELLKYRVSLNPFGAMVSTFKSNPEDLIFANETVTHSLVPEPSDDQKNEYFRAWPRNLIEFPAGCLLKRNPALCTPGETAALLADPDMFYGFAEIEAEEGSPQLQMQAKAILEMRGHEHMPQHMEKAQRAMKIYSPGTGLSKAGLYEQYSHADLIRRGGFIFLVSGQRYIDHLAPHIGLHLLAFCDALYQGAGRLVILADEWTNFPARELISRMTTLRAYGGELLMISQSPSEVIRKFSEEEAETAEDNSITKQWLGFSNFREAEKISKAMGEEHAVATGLSSDNDSLKLQTSLSLIKQQHMTPAELMAMPKEQCLVHIKGVGFMVLTTVSQENIAPYCDLIAPNPLEGGKLRSDPKITLVTPRSGP